MVVALATQQVCAFMICPPRLTTTARATTTARCRRCTHPLALSPNIAPQDVPGGKILPDPPQFIHILGEDGVEQKLPMASASRFPLWVIEHDAAGGKRAVEVPGESGDEGWVNPRSYGKMWIPADCPAPSMKLCLGMLTKDGQPRYVMPTVDAVVDKGGKKWRNRGLKTVPSANCWEPVARAASGSLLLSAYVEEKVEGSNTDSIWGPLAENVAVTDAFSDLVAVISDPPEGLDLGEGFHFLVTEVIGGGPFPMPACGGRVRAFLTDLPNPARILEVPDLRDVAEISFDVVAVASGGDSEFLPDVYRGLFAPESTQI